MTTQNFSIPQTSGASDSEKSENPWKLYISQQEGEPSKPRNFPREEDVIRATVKYKDFDENDIRFNPISVYNFLVRLYNVAECNRFKGRYLEEATYLTIYGVWFVIMNGCGCWFGHMTILMLYVCPIANIICSICNLICLVMICMAWSTKGSNEYLVPNYFCKMFLDSENSFTHEIPFRFLKINEQIIDRICITTHEKENLLKIYRERIADKDFGLELSKPDKIICNEPIINGVPQQQIIIMAYHNVLSGCIDIIGCGTICLHVGHTLICLAFTGIMNWILFSGNW